MDGSRSDIPDPSIRRLSVYLRQLEALEAGNITRVSSASLATSLHVTAAQVRKDLAHFGQFGRAGVGYEVAPLIRRLKLILGTDRVSGALLVGVGNVGRALATYQGFRPKGFELRALFDIDHRKVGHSIGSLKIEPIEKLAPIVKRRSIRLGIIATPAEAAQFATDRLVSAGIRGILSFAPTPLSVPDHVAVRRIDVAAELEQLNFAIGR